jgi:signal transduction histidine kinase
VQDTGIGMSPAELQRIYEPFWQAESAMHARSGGTGLGLPVSRQLVELLGGSIDVRSSRGEGSTFTVRLPLRYLPAPDDEEA